MRKTRFLLALTFLLSLATFAANSVLGSYNLTAGSATPPSSSTDGYALAGGQAKGFTVTVADVRDGSVGDALDQVSTVDAYAWCYNSTQGRWARATQLDLSMRMTDGGTGVASAGFPAGQTATTTWSSSASNVSVGAFDCSRIYYTTGNVNLSYDGGSLVHRVTITQNN